MFHHKESLTNRNSKELASCQESTCPEAMQTEPFFWNSSHPHQNRTPLQSPAWQCAGQHTAQEGRAGAEAMLGSRATLRGTLLRALPTLLLKSFSTQRKLQPISSLRTVTIRGKSTWGNGASILGHPGLCWSGNSPSTPPSMLHTSPYYLRNLQSSVVCSHNFR